jgi:sensor histidine kinase YesM
MKNIADTKKGTPFNIVMSIVFIIGTSTMFGFIFQGSQLFSSFTYYIKFTSYGLGLGFSFWLGHWAIDTYTKNKLDWTKNLKKANVISLSLYIIYGIIVSIITSYLFGRFVLENTGQSLFWDAFIKTLIIMVLDLMFISIYYSTNLTKYWKKAIEANEELKRETLIAKYEALKNQVNPHFLFNNLNTLCGMVEQNSELAPDFIRKLSDIYRYVLEQNDKDLVPIKDEMKFVDDYIFLSKMRFGTGLMFNSHITDNQNLLVVPLGIQMLVENVIKHNIIADDMPLKIEMEIEDGFIIVRNNLQKKRTINSGKEPLGLENLKKRYDYLSGVSVEVIESDNEFIVKLPIIEP